MEKIFFFDLETTGLSHDKHGIHQISAIVEVNGKIEAEFDLKLKPFEGCMINAEALAIGNVTVEQLKEYPDEKEAYSKIVETLCIHCDKFDKYDKFHLAGFNNASFDNQFLRRLWDRCNDRYFGSFFWSDTLDVMVLASYHLKANRHKMLNFKLHTVAKAMGIEVDESKLHDASYDLKLTREIFYKLKLGV